MNGRHCLRKVFSLCLAILLTVCATAQVVTTLQLPPLGVTIKPQLWNMSLINTSGDVMNVKIELEITDVSNGQRVITGTSRTFTLPAGVKQIQPADVTPITYVAGTPGYPVDVSPGGFLPIGVFDICVSVIKVDIDAPEQVSEECVAIEVEPLSPPQLIIPLDEEKVEFTRPLFAWMPPMPFNSISATYYDWILVEVQITQSAADAIQQNVPVLTQQNVQLTSFQYPMSMPELDTAKLYAWRITAKNNASPVANSEIWTFKVQKFQQDTIKANPGGYFAKLHREENAAYTICTGILRFEFQSDQNLPSADIRIVDLSSDQLKGVALDSSTYSIRYGQNFVQVDLRESGEMKNGHMYLLELRSGNEKWYLKFEFRKSENE